MRRPIPGNLPQVRVRGGGAVRTAPSRFGGFYPARQPLSRTGCPWEPRRQINVLPPNRRIP
jgi:hypothetical protein